MENDAPITRQAATDTWLKEALTHLSGELLSFARTLTAFAFRPARSARAWQAGTHQFMNPLGFAATGAAGRIICIVLAKAMRALHRTAAWKVMLAAVFAVVVTSVLFGSVLPDGNFGWRPYIEVDWQDDIGFSFGFRG